MTLLRLAVSMLRLRRYAPFPSELRGRARKWLRLRLINTQKLHVLDLCRAFGWSNPKRAMVYYNPAAGDIAKRL